MNNTPLITVLVVGGTTALRVGYDPNVSDKGSAYGKIAVGGFALGAILALISTGSPQVATAIGVTVCIAALVLNGTALMTATNTVFRK